MMVKTILSLISLEILQHRRNIIVYDSPEHTVFNGMRDNI